MRNLKSLRESLSAKLISRVTKHTTPSPQPGHNKPKFLNKMNKRMRQMGEGRADDAFAELEKEKENKPAPIEPKRASEVQGKATKIKDMNPLDREQWKKEKEQAGIKD